MARPLIHTAFFAALVGIPSAINAADHFDGPALVEDPSTDIADLYAWMTADGTKVNLVMDLVAVRFSDAVQYVFHLESSAALGQAGTAQDLICTFTAEQRVGCWLDDEYAGGDASASQGVSSASGKMLVFAASRSDPFFFNAEGFAATLSKVKAAAGSLTFDAAGCPAVDAATSEVLVRGLQTRAFGEPPQNFFRSRRVSALVVQVDKALVTPGGPVLSVWASTRR
jgi:hypothetical protein